MVAKRMELRGAVQVHTVELTKYNPSESTFLEAVTKLLWETFGQRFRRGRETLAERARTRWRWACVQNAFIGGARG